MRMRTSEGHGGSGKENAADCLRTFPFVAWGAGPWWGRPLFFPGGWLVSESSCSEQAGPLERLEDTVVLFLWSRPSAGIINQHRRHDRRRPPGSQSAPARKRHGSGGRQASGSIGTVMMR